MSTLAISAPTRPLPSRSWAALRALGRRVVDHLATDNGWFWAYGVWYPYLGAAGDTAGRGDDQQP